MSLLAKNKKIRKLQITYGKDKTKQSKSVLFSLWSLKVGKNLIILDQKEENLTLKKK